MRPTEPLVIHRVKIKALSSRFYVNGALAVPQQTYEVDHADAVTLEYSRKAEILGPAKPRYIPISALCDPPPKPRGALESPLTRWSLF